MVEKSKLTERYQEDLMNLRRYPSARAVASIARRSTCQDELEQLSKNANIHVVCEVAKNVHTDSDVINNLVNHPWQMIRIEAMACCTDSELLRELFKSRFDVQEHKTEGSEYTQRMMANIYTPVDIVQQCADLSYFKDTEITRAAILNLMLRDMKTNREAIPWALLQYVIWFLAGAKQKDIVSDMLVDEFGKLQGKYSNSPSLKLILDRSIGIGKEIDSRFGKGEMPTDDFCIRAKLFADSKHLGTLER